MSASETRPKPFVFVLMPFASEFEDIYKLGIREACKKAGAYCERLDDQIFSENMLERIYSQIDKSDLIVADMTGRNPNVFYEVGYAHALGKTVILLTNDGADIPFDLKHHPHLIYSGSIDTLQKELQKRIRHHLKHPDKAIDGGLADIVLYINDQPASGNPTIQVAVHQRKYSEWSDQIANNNIIQEFVPIRLSIHHCQKNSFENIQVGVQLITPSVFSRCMLVSSGMTTVYSSVKMPEEKTAHRPAVSGMYVSPGEWDAIEFPLCTADNRVSAPACYPSEFQLIRSGPPLRFPFLLALYHRTSSDQSSSPN